MAYSPVFLTISTHVRDEGESAIFSVALLLAFADCNIVQTGGTSYNNKAVKMCLWEDNCASAT